MAVPEDVLEAIRGTVGPKGWIGDAGGMEPYLIEERGIYRGACDMVVLPQSTAEVAAVVGHCARADVAIVPQGGNTGLVGGGVPEGGIVLSTARLDRIRGVDPFNHTLTAEAGCVLANVQAAADEAGAYFPLSLAAEGSCRIGGNLSTNAGGIAVLRYGTARDLVLGLEVVLPDGQVWDGLRRLRKDNTGYDLKQLFIGAEGTLGIITAAVLKLFPAPRTRVTVLAAVPGMDTVMDLFVHVREGFGDALVAFEVISRLGLDIGLEHIPGVIDPFQSRHGYYALLEVTSPRTGEGLRESLETHLADALEKGIAADAVIASSERQAQELWRIRDAVPEAQKLEGGSIKHDVSVPVSRVVEFIDRATGVVEKDLPGVRVLAFGHLGDGNIHFNLLQPKAMDRDDFLSRWDHMNRLVHDVAVELDGSFSAEHGIGRLKRGDMKRYKSAVELNLMRTLKSALDPKNIMNPGKIL
ncbi:MAG: FAD-binding oxidoreductase [Proteobacteria bacterium]|nr:FAD-binding oxidoreductase [Pseudomonadota bacterium]